MRASAKVPLVISEASCVCDAAANALAALPPEAVRAAKALVRDPEREAAHEAVNREAAQFLQRLMSAEAAEAMQAFLERRQPDFSRFE